MVKNCCVLGCTSNTKRNPAISFFRFPTDVTLASMWLQLIGRPDFKPSQYSVICQLHFTRDDFTSGSHHYPITGIGGQRKRLKTKAIPTQNLNGCTNPEVLAEIQMRAKTTFPQQKLSKSMMSNANTMVNANTMQNNSNNEAAQLQQLLTSLMPALFGNDNTTNNTLNNNNNTSNKISLDSGTNNVTSSTNSLTSGLSTPQGSFTNSPQGGYTNGISTPPFSSAASPPSVATTQGPIISLPSSLQNISLADSSVQSNGTLFSNTNSALTAEPIMSTPILKKEPVSSTDHAIFKISNGNSLPSNLTHNSTVLSSNHLPSNQPSNQPSNGTAVIRTNGPTPSTEDLYTELQNSLLALKQNFSSDSSHGHIVKSQSPSLVQVQQPIAHEIPMETGNNAYIIDVDTYQKLMETVSQKSEKSIQTEQDITICSLQSEIKQLKDQLCQYELAFNSLINWTEGSLKTDPVPQATAPSESKLIEGTLIE